jgi:cytochrome d ubiquinol oxidase subunit II
VDLQILWFAILGVLLGGYAVLDGFDLGVGILHPFARTDQERRLFMNAIGPLWDGNEVWLVTFGGALFAAFPNAYASAFSSFYLPFMLLLFALIFRGVSLEFRSKRPERVWRAFWDYSFFGASTLATFLFGVAVGNSMIGLPLDAHGVFRGETMDLVSPYSCLIGLLAVSAFAVHGANYLHLKLEGDIRAAVGRWRWTAFGLFLVLYLFATIATLVGVDRALENFRSGPISWGLVGLNVLAVANVPRTFVLDKPLQAFVSSGAVILALVALFGAALFPNMVTSTLDPDWSITVYNASSSEKTLTIMAIIAAIGMPFVLAYTVAIYWVFRGKVSLDKFSY